MVIVLNYVLSKRAGDSVLRGLLKANAAGDQTLSLIPVPPSVAARSCTARIGLYGCRIPQGGITSLKEGKS